MEQYVNNSECKQLDVGEVEECSLGLEHADVDAKAEKGELLVASKWRWEDCQKTKKSQEEQAWKERQETEVEEQRKRCVAFEEATNRMLK